MVIPLKMDGIDPYPNMIGISECLFPSANQTHVAANSTIESMLFPATFDDPEGTWSFQVAIVVNRVCSPSWKRRNFRTDQATWSKMVHDRIPLIEGLLDRRLQSGGMLQSFKSSQKWWFFVAFYMISAWCFETFGLWLSHHIGNGMSSSQLRRTPWFFREVGIPPTSY